MNESRLHVGQLFVIVSNKLCTHLSDLPNQLDDLHRSDSSFVQIPTRPIYRLRTSSCVDERVARAQ